MGVFDPDVLVFGGELAACIRILDKDRGVRLYERGADAALVVDPVLQGEGGGYDVVVGAEVVELAVGEVEQAAAQFADLWVGGARVVAEVEGEVPVEVVSGALLWFARLVCFPVAGAFHEQLDGSVAEEPDADIEQEEVVGAAFVDFPYAWLLQDIVELVRGLALGEEDAVLGGAFGSIP